MHILTDTYVNTQFKNLKSTKTFLSRLFVWAFRLRLCPDPAFWQTHLRKGLHNLLSYSVSYWDLQTKKGPLQFKVLQTLETSLLWVISLQDVLTLRESDMSHTPFGGRVSWIPDWTWTHCSWGWLWILDPPASISREWEFTDACHNIQVTLSWDQTHDFTHSKQAFYQLDHILALSHTLTKQNKTLL